MKVTRIYFTLFYLFLIVGHVTAQIKVTNGQVVVGSDGIPGAANLESKTNIGTLELALNSAVGNPDFTFQEIGQTRGQVKYVLGRQGIEIQIDDNHIGNSGLSGGTTVMHLNTSGNVGIGTRTPSTKLDVNGSISYNGTLTNTSDRRLKTNTSDFIYGLDAIMALRPINYQFNGKANTPTKTNHVGLFAQDLQKIAPSLVSTWTHNEYEDETPEMTAKEISPKVISSTEYLSINDSAIKYMLVNAIKEQQQIIKKKSQEITELKVLLQQLQQQVDNIQQKIK